MVNTAVIFTVMSASFKCSLCSLILGRATVRVLAPQIGWREISLLFYMLSHMSWHKYCYLQFPKECLHILCFYNMFHLCYWLCKNVNIGHGSSELPLIWTIHSQMYNESKPAQTLNSCNFCKSRAAWKRSIKNIIWLQKYHSMYLQ